MSRQRSWRQIRGNWFLTLLSLAIALIPVWLYFIAKHFLNPDGFWQNLILLGVGAYLLGWLQAILLILWLFALYLIWD